MTEDPQANPRPPEPMPMDRVGWFMENLAEAGKRMTDRNLKLWSNISRNLRERDKQPYTMDRWSDDAAAGMQTALENAQDAWDFMMRPPERERVADPLPFAFLLIQWRGERQYVAADPVWMRVSAPENVKLPETATIELTGDNSAGVAALRRCLTATRGESRQAYLLEVTNVNSGLQKGIYSGSVYVKASGSVIPIANLRVIVEGPGE